MRTINCTLWFLAALVWWTGCTANHLSTPALGETQDKTLQSEAQLCNPHCEQVAYSYKTDPNTFHPIGLGPTEAASLKATLESTAVSGNSEKLHVHADAIKGQLVFLPDSPSDPTRESHLSGELISMRNISGSSPAIRIVPTPAALELLRQKETRTSGLQ